MEIIFGTSRLKKLCENEKDLVRNMVLRRQMH